MTMRTFEEARETGLFGDAVHVEGFTSNIGCYFDEALDEVNAFQCIAWDENDSNRTGFVDLVVRFERADKNKSGGA
eukprot:6523925-Pyramimonas_sp.AAC.1